MSATAIDIRAGMTSASNAQNDRLCPGRHLAQRGLAETESNDAAAGTLIHRAFAGEDVPLNAQQRKTLERGQYLEEGIFRGWISETETASAWYDLPISEQVAKLLNGAQREQRLWLTDRNGQPMHSGSIDAYWISEDKQHALIIDYKSLFGDVSDATENEQLRDYAALLSEADWMLETVTVAIIQPNVRWKLEDQVLVTYDFNALRQARVDMLARVEASNRIDAPRVPGLKQCQFCRAAGTARCPESQQVILSSSKLASLNWETATREDRGALIEKLKTAEALIDKAIKTAKASIEAEPDSVAGWTIKPGAFERKLSPDALMEVGAILGERFPGMTAQKLLSVCKPSVPALEELFAELNGTPASKSKSEFEALFGALIERKQKAGSLAQIK